MIEAILVDKLLPILGLVSGEILKKPLKQIVDERDLRRSLLVAVKRAEERFAREYTAFDAELTAVLVSQTRFADLPSVQEALHEILRHPFHDPGGSMAIVHKSFNEVLPKHTDRSRVDAAVSTFLRILGDEVVYIPQLQPLYSLFFQRVSAESSQAMVANLGVVAQSVQELQEIMRQSAPPALPTAEVQPLLERAHPWHNLPQRAFSQFIGREAELTRLNNLMLPYPQSRHFLITLDGIGGVGKSALALELAHRYRTNYNNLSQEERFEAIVWVSAKRTLLTASGIKQRPSTFNTLDDLYREIANVLENPLITQADKSQRRALVERSLRNQRTLLIIDNLETVDDEELITFLHDLPDPTKAIITTRHRIDIAYPIRLNGMPEADALELMWLEAERKDVVLTAETIHELFRRTGGIPLALEWSIGLLSLGHSPETVLRRLRSGQSDIARFCFTESVDRIRNREAYRLLFGLALFESSVSRKMLGKVAGLGDDEVGRDEGLAELLQLSLINQKGNRFKLLPLTHSYLLDELSHQAALENELRQNWIAELSAFARPFCEVTWQWRDGHRLKKDGKHFLTLVNWAEQSGQLQLLLDIFPAVASYYSITGDWNAMIQLSETCLDYARLSGDAKIIIHIESHVLAWALSQQGEYRQAEQHALNALNNARRHEDLLLECRALLRYAQVLRRAGRAEEALVQCQKVSEILAQDIDLSPVQRDALLADLEYELGRIARDDARWADAYAHLIKARDLFGYNEDDPEGCVERAWSVLGELGFVVHQLGDLYTASNMYQQSIKFFADIGGKGYMTTLLVRLALLESQRRNYSQALSYASEALDWSKRLGMIKEQAEAEALYSRLENINT